MLYKLLTYLLGKLFQTPNSDKNWQTSCPNVCHKLLLVVLFRVLDKTRSNSKSSIRPALFISLFYAVRNNKYSLLAKVTAREFFSIKMAVSVLRSVRLGANLALSDKVHVADRIVVPDVCFIRYSECSERSVL